MGGGLSRSALDHAEPATPKRSKLSLKKTTVRLLTPTELAQVVGGVAPGHSAIAHGPNRSYSWRCASI